MRRAALACVVALAPAALVADRLPQTIFRARADIVVIDAAVADGRKPVTSLKKEDFELTDNGVVQQILDFDRERLPLDVTLTIDMSGSMTPTKRAVVERGIAQVSAALGPTDRGAVVTFATRISERMPLQAPPIQADLNTRPGGTSILDAMLLSLVTAPMVDRRQLSLFMTDGDDTTSYFNAITVIETAKFANGQTSIVVVRDDDQLNNGLILTVFRSVASATGGEMIELKKDDDLSKAFLTALDNFRTSYVLRYAPTGVSGRGWHDVTVKVKSKNYSVRARRGYWADAGGAPAPANEAR